MKQKNKIQLYLLVIMLILCTGLYSAHASIVNDFTTVVDESEGLIDRSSAPKPNSPEYKEYQEKKANEKLASSAGDVINNYYMVGAAGASGPSHVTVEIDYPYVKLVESINDTMTTFAARAILGDDATADDFRYFRSGGTGGGTEPVAINTAELSRYGIGGGIAPVPIPGIKENLFGNNNNDGYELSYLTIDDFDDNGVLKEEVYYNGNKTHEFIQLYENLSENNSEYGSISLSDGKQLYNTYSIVNSNRDSYVSALNSTGSSGSLKSDYIKKMSSGYGIPADQAIHMWNNVKDFYSKNPNPTAIEIWDNVVQPNATYFAEAKYGSLENLVETVNSKVNAGTASPLEYAYAYLKGDGYTDSLKNNPYGLSEDDMVSTLNTVFSPEVNNKTTYETVKDEKGNEYTVQKPTDPSKKSTTNMDTETIADIHNENSSNLSIVSVFNDLFNRVADYYYNPQNLMEGVRTDGWNITIKIALALIPLVVILSMVTYFRSGAGDLVAAKETIINLVVNIGLAISSYFITTQIINISIGISKAIMPGQSDFFTMNDADFQMGVISTVLTIVFLFVVLLFGLIVVFEFYMASAAAQIVFAISTISAPLMIILSTYKPLEYLRSMWLKQLTTMLILLPSNAIILRVISALITLNTGDGIGRTIFKFVVVLGCVSVMIGLNSQAAKQVFSGITTALDNTIGKAQRISQLRSAGSHGLAGAAAGAGGGDGGSGSSGGSNLPGQQTMGANGVSSGYKGATTQIANPGGGLSSLFPGSTLSMQAAEKVSQATSGTMGTAAEIQKRSSTPAGRASLANELQKSMNGGAKTTSKGQGAGNKTVGGKNTLQPQPVPGKTGSTTQTLPGGSGSSNNSPKPQDTSLPGNNPNPQPTPLPGNDQTKQGTSTPTPAPSIDPVAGQEALDMLNGANQNHRVSREIFDFNTNVSDMTSANYSRVASGMEPFKQMMNQNPEAFQRFIDTTTAANNVANNAMAGAHVVQETGRDPSNYNEIAIYQSMGQAYAFLNKQGAMPDIDISRMPDAFVRGMEIQQGVSAPASPYEASFSGVFQAKGSKEMYRSAMNNLSDYMMRL